MTIVALRRGRQMIKVFTHGRDAIVATAAGAQHLEVVHRYRRIPKVGAMAVLADVGGADMVKTLTGRGYAIMAVTTALSSNILVIEVGG